jgi:hypothetical protein
MFRIDINLSADFWRSFDFERDFDRLSFFSGFS